MKPKLYLFVGYPGAGKTTVSRVIADATGAEHIWADSERNKMFHRPQHTEAESQELYNALNKRARDLLKSGASVIFDTNFNHRKDRDLLRDIAKDVGAETRIVWITTPVAVARQRALESNVVRNGYEFAMSSDQFDDIANKLEPPAEDEVVIKIDGTNIDREEILALVKS